MLPENRKPVHPGRILRKDFLEPAGLSAEDLADETSISLNRLEKIMNEEANVDKEVAIELGKYFGTTSYFWMNLQVNHKAGGSE